MCRSGSEKQNLSKQEQIVVAFPHEQNVVQQQTQLKYDVMNNWETSVTFIEYTCLEACKSFV
jgi:hypothetical protein